MPALTADLLHIWSVERSELKHGYDNDISKAYKL